MPYERILFITLGKYCRLRFNKRENGFGVYANRLLGGVAIVVTLAKVYIVAVLALSHFFMKRGLYDYITRLMEILRWP